MFKMKFGCLPLRRNSQLAFRTGLIVLIGHVNYS